MAISRRRFLYLTGAGTLALGTGLETIAAASNHQTARPDFRPDIEIALTAKPTEQRLFPGPNTFVWQYTGKLLKGPSQAFEIMPNSYLGPIIRAQRGDKVRIHFHNDLPDDSIIHWHGLHVPADMDGHPRHVIQQGASYTYTFEILNPAGTYWYHPHPHGQTGYQVYGGLAGLFLVSDQREQALGLPHGDYDIPLVIQDRIFDRDNQLVYLPGGMMSRMIGFLGDTVLVNGQPDFKLPVDKTAYRLRLLNGSNSRIYRLAWDDGSPLTVIGTDGGLLPQPVHRKRLMLAPGERVELWADFASYSDGARPRLVSEAFDAGPMSGGRGRGPMMGGRGQLPLGAPLSILTAVVNSGPARLNRLPQQLVPFERYELKAAVNADQPRRFHLAMQHMAGTINGRMFGMYDVADDEYVRLDTLEVWEFVNQRRGMGMMGMMAMPHPMHLHGKQFQVLDRYGAPFNDTLDAGWKDTVLVWPGERVRLLVKFETFPGLFLYHCHNLEHEDLGMMRNYEVI